jgi:hypothetical protein
VTCGRCSRFERLERLRLSQDGVFGALKRAVERGLSKAGLMLLCGSGNARLCVKRFEMTRKIEIKRFSLTTSKQFDARLFVCPVEPVRRPPQIEKPLPEWPPSLVTDTVSETLKS